LSIVIPTQLLSTATLSSHHPVNDKLLLRDRSHTLYVVNPIRNLLLLPPQKELLSLPVLGFFESTIRNLHLLLLPPQKELLPLPVHAFFESTIIYNREYIFFFDYMLVKPPYLNLLNVDYRLA
jgi:hypothetical protein